jgi:hypothetical protein
MCIRAMGGIGLVSCNFVCQNTKSQNFDLLDPKNGDFDKLYLHDGPVGTRGDQSECCTWLKLCCDIYILRSKLLLVAPDPKQ